MPDKDKTLPLMGLSGMKLPKGPRQFQPTPMPDLRGLGASKGKYHPKDVEESRMEKWIKEQALKQGAFTDDDNPYLEQYLHPDKDILERQYDRPPDSAKGIRRDLEYRKPHVNINLTKNSDEVERLFDEYKKKPEGMKRFNEYQGQVDKLPDEVAKRYNVEGLGSYNYNTSNKDYDTIYDVWDFNTESPLTKDKYWQNRHIIPSLADLKDLAAKKLMQQVGKPYAVYERVPKGSAGTGFVKK